MCFQNLNCELQDKKAPYIDLLEDGLCVAGGGCGYAAKSCDEIGRIAASLALTGTWDSDLDREMFRAKFKSPPGSHE